MTQGPLEKAHQPRACCSAPRKCRLVLECGEILQGSDYGPEFGRGLTSPNDDGLDEVNDVILLALSDEPFSSARQKARRIGFQNALYLVGLSILWISR
jgi:hypothetical protein